MAAKSAGAPPPTVEIRQSGTVCVVSEGHLRVKKDGYVVVSNRSGGTVTAFFPEGELFHELNGKPRTIEIPDTKDYKAKVKGKQPPKPGNRYEYAVFCDVTGNFAIANSNPEIIIDF